MKKYGSLYGAPKRRDTEACIGHRNKEIKKPVWGAEMKKIRKPVWGTGMKKYENKYAALE
jgi:hypothetical protein